MRTNIIIHLIAITLAVVVQSTPVTQRTSRHVLHEKRPAVRRDWEKVERVHREVPVPVRIGLAQQNLHLAENFMNEVAHPESSQYGQHWSPDKVAETFGPKQEAVEAVTDWLVGEGVHPSRLSLTRGGHWLTFTATVGELERLLRTEYHVFQHATAENIHVACDSYHIPEHLQEHIDIITPTVHFDQRIGHDKSGQWQELSDNQNEELKKRSSFEKRQASSIAGTPNDGSNPKQGATIVNALMALQQCDTMITPSCLRALYNMPKGTSALSNNSLGIVEYTPQAFLQKDLDMYFSNFEPALTGKPPKIRLVDNAIVQQTNQSFAFNGESALDLQFTMALVYPQTTTLFQVGSLAQGASFNNFLDSVDASYCGFQGGDDKDPTVDGQYPANINCGSTTPTKVISTSYSFNEADLTPRYEQRQCMEYMKLGLQGITVIYSSGDFGVAGNGNQCLDPSTGALNDGKSGRFNPSFPGGCPWITSVGATQILNGSSVFDAEAACETAIFSGGGFSNVFKAPSYQSKTVKRYMKDLMKGSDEDVEKRLGYVPEERFNISGMARGFPDVAANGANYVTAVNGRFQLSFGTSAAAPTFASVISLINEQRLLANKSSVGFINPALYANPQVLNDVVQGKNPGCGTQGFEAGKGWDPLTGLGTPNYSEMERMFMSLP